MRFAPTSADRLPNELADWIRRSPSGHPTAHPVVGIDGPAEVGATALADGVATALAALGRPALRVSTGWWWRSAALRLEFGRRDVDMLLTGWVDAAALTREVFGPLASGAGAVITRLRDPATDRSVREPAVAVRPHAPVVVDGPFLLATDLPLQRLVHLRLSPAALARALPDERAWWLDGFERYGREYAPEDRADVVVAYDHPRSPAIAWAAGSR